MNNPYNHRWRKARLQHLRKQPLCVMCLADTPSRVTAADVVDHIVRHGGDEAIFWDRGNWQSLCRHCHDSRKQALECSGRERVAFDERGNPIG